MKDFAEPAFSHLSTHARRSRRAVKTQTKHCLDGAEPRTRTIAGCNGSAEQRKRAALPRSGVFFEATSLAVRVDDATKQRFEVRGRQGSPCSFKKIQSSDGVFGFGLFTESTKSPASFKQNMSLATSPDPKLCVRRVSLPF